MWKLQPADPQSAAIPLIAGKDYVVGRKSCDILLVNDQSISREHAHLTVTEQTVTLQDKSKYGTFVNDKRLDSASTQTLYAGDRVTFGVFQSKFKLELGSVVVCSSCVDTDGKTALSRAVQAVGGRLVNTWCQECTHLVMPSVKVTIKTICALLCCRPIVKPEFFTQLSKAVQQRESLPKAESFRPELDEPSLSKDKVDLSPRPERKNLFRGKMFVFLNIKQIKRLSQAISFGGGKSQLLDEGALPASLLESTDTCVIDAIIGSSQPLIHPISKSWADSVGQILHRKGLRFIPESEIGLAAIYASNQTYCNPCSSSDSAPSQAQISIPGGTVSQNAVVDETFFPPASLNITTYVVNTESSQSASRKDVGGVAAVSETPEKRPANQQRITSSSTVPNKTPALTKPPSATFGKASELNSQSQQKQGSRLAKGNSECANSDSLNSSSTLKKSPQKQSSLTAFFQPVNKKRPREDSANSELSESKLSRLEAEDQESQKSKVSNPPAFIENKPNTREDSHTGFSTSKGLGSGLSTGFQTHSDSRAILVSKKRKEPDQSPKASELDLSLEELESIMSVDMDEDVQPTAGKKQCLDLKETPKRKGETLTDGDASSSTNQQMEKQQTKKSSNPEQDQLISANQDPGKKPWGTSKNSKDVTLEELSQVKEEEVSFVVATKGLKGFVEQSEVPGLKQEVKESNSESDPELPRRVLQVQFKSLTVNAPCRTRTEPLQSRDPNGKNFKCFRKVPVPGLQGLPKIIGGSDLVPHNRSKNSELLEWMREEAEVWKQQEKEESLANELFRYNPKSSKRR